MHLRLQAVALGVTVGPHHILSTQHAYHSAGLHASNHRQLPGILGAHLVHSLTERLVRIYHHDRAIRHTRQCGDWLGKSASTANKASGPESLVMRAYARAFPARTARRR